MKVLLVNPPFSLFHKYDPRTPSLALLYLAAVLEKEGFQVKIFDASLGNINKVGSQYYYGVSKEEIRNTIEEYNPRIVGITCLYSARWPFVQDIARTVKRVQPLALTVIGGIHPSASTTKCLEECSDIDFIIIGEGEFSFLELCRAISSNGELSQIDGLGYREKGQIKINPKTKFIKDLDSLPLPAYHLVDLEKYFRVSQPLYDFKGRMLPVLSSRSCPMGCYFCDMFITHGSKWRSRSAANVVDEIEFLHKTYHVDSFSFMDDNLTFNRQRVVEICNEIKRRELRIRWNTPNGVMMRTLDAELINLMKSAGLVSLCFGIESGSEYIRNVIYGKHLSTEKIQGVVNSCVQSGIKTNGFFLVGAPQETDTTIRESIALVKKLPLSTITVSVLTPYIGTKLFDDCLEKGYLGDQDKITRIVSGNIETHQTPCIATENFDAGKVKRWRKELYKAFIKSHFWQLLFDTILRRNKTLNWVAAVKVLRSIVS